MRMFIPMLSAIVFAACGNRTVQRESQMTSFTAGETKSDTANLFTVPADQIGHLQIAAARCARSWSCPETSCELGSRC
jgi:hypothetical protein